MESNDSTDDSTDTDLTKHAIDTDSEPLLEKVSAALPREPFAIDVAFRAVALERVDLEREPGERSADWIRGAVDDRLSVVEYLGDGDRHEDVPQSRPADYTPAADSDDEQQLLAAVSSAAPGDWIGVTVAFTAQALDAIGRNCDDGQTVADWIRDAVETRFAAIDRNFEGSTAVKVDVPPEIAKRARLRAQHAVESYPAKDYQSTLRNALLQLCNPAPVYHVDGDVISPPDEGDSLDD